MRTNLKVKQVLAFVLIAAVLSLAVVACDSPDEAAKQELRIGMAPWVNSVPIANLAKQLIEENTDWQVTIVEADIGMIWSDVAAGGLDFSLDAALPYYHAAYAEEHGDNLEMLEPIYHLPAGSLVVPAYVPIDSIAELNDYADEFNGQIIGLEPGAGINAMTQEAMEVYGLDNFTLVESSDYGMTTTLADAIENNEWVVVTGWEPHWKNFQWDLKYLADPEKIYGDEGYHVPIIREGLSDDAPEIVDFLNKLYIELEDLNGMIFSTDVEGEPLEDVIQRWIDANSDNIAQWFNQ